MFTKYFFLDTNVKELTQLLISGTLTKENMELALMVDMVLD